MGNGLTRLQTRFFGEPESVAEAQQHVGEALDAEAAEELGLVTFAYDEHRLGRRDAHHAGGARLLLARRADRMEANLRFPGPETMETRIFGRLTAWQNWVFQRPNAVGENGALQRYGSGMQPRLRSANRSLRSARRTTMPDGYAERRLRRPDPEQCRPQRGCARAQGAGDLASRLYRLVEGHGAGRVPGEPGLSAHRDQRGPEGLGEVRLRAGCRNTNGASCSRPRWRAAPSRSARTRASRRGRRCRASTAPCCAACS